MSFSYEKNKTKNSYKYKEIMNAINNFGVPTQEYKNHQFLNSTMTNQRNSNAYSPLNYKTISTLRPNNNYQTYKSKSKNIFGLKLDLTNKDNEKLDEEKKKCLRKLNYWDYL